jgi:hypothetical protein
MSPYRGVEASHRLRAYRSRPGPWHHESTKIDDFVTWRLSDAGRSGFPHPEFRTAV